MQLKRIFVTLFAVLSVIALWDMTRTGPSSFGSIFDQTLGQIDLEHGRVPVRKPDFEERRTLEPFSGIGGVIIDETLGRLEIVRSESGDVTAEYTVRIWWKGDSDAVAEEAASLAEKVSVAWEREGARARLKVERPGALPAEVAQLLVDVRVGVPDGVEVTAAHTGEVLVQGTSGTLRLEHTGGKVTVQGVRGAVTVASRFSSLVIHRIQGSVDVEQKGGDLNLRQIEGSVGGRIQLGMVALEDVAGDVALSIERGIARIENVRGDVDLAGRYGQLEVFLEGEGGWRVDAVAEMGEVDTDLELRRETSGARTELSGVLGDGAHRLKIRVEQGAARLTRR